MTIKYLDSKRLSGITADRTGSSAVSGGWKELGRTTVGSATDSINVSSLPDKRYYMILHNHVSTGYTNKKLRFNSDTGSNYARRKSYNGGTDSTQINQNMLYVGATGTTQEFGMGYMSNKSDKEKLLIWHYLGDSSTGAGNVPIREEIVGKWANTSDAISSVNLINDGSGSFGSGDEVVVLGWDDTDTHTTNFWEELASVELGSSASEIDSGTITAKKYLMYSIFQKKSSGGTSMARLQFNSDTGSNYAQRNSINGTDYDYGSQTSMNIGGDGVSANEGVFYTGFIINNSANEKLLIGHSVSGNASGAGNIPNRGEIANKWANTSSQITSIKAMNLTFDTGSIMKVWGSN